MFNLTTAAPSRRVVRSSAPRHTGPLGLTFLVGLLSIGLVLPATLAGCNSGSRHAGTSTGAAATAGSTAPGATTGGLPPGLVPGAGAAGSTSGTTPPAGTRSAYVSNFTLDEVVRVDTVTAVANRRVAVGGKPTDVASTLGHPYAYVTNATTQDISVLDPLTDTVVATIALTNNGVSLSGLPLIGSLLDPLLEPLVRPTGIALTPSGDKAVVANLINIQIIDTGSRQVTHSILPLNTQALSLSNLLSSPASALQSFMQAPFSGLGQVRVACTQDKAYVTNMVTNNVSVVDLASGRITTTIPVGRLPLGIAVARNGMAYVACSLDNAVYVIDTRNDTLFGGPLMLSGLLPAEVSVDPLGGAVYVSEFASGEIAVIDPNLNLPIGTIPAGLSLAGILQQMGINIGGSSGGGQNPLQSLFGSFLSGLTGGAAPGTAGSGLGGTLGGLLGGGAGSAPSGPNAILGSILGAFLQSMGLNGLPNLPAIGLQGIDVSRDSARVVSSGTLLGDINVTEIQTRQVTNQIAVLSPGPSSVCVLP